MWNSYPKSMGFNLKGFRQEAGRVRLEIVPEHKSFRSLQRALKIFIANYVALALKQNPEYT